MDDVLSTLNSAALIINSRAENYDANTRNGDVNADLRENFENIARLASLKLRRVFHPFEVAVILESVKDMRRAISPGHEDSTIDGLSYKAIAALFGNDYERWRSDFMAPRTAPTQPKAVAPVGAPASPAPTPAAGPDTSAPPGAPQVNGPVPGFLNPTAAAPAAQADPDQPTQAG